MAALGKTFIALGFMLFVVAVAWWYLFYSQFFGDDVKRASDCFYYTTDLCSVGNLAAVISDVPVYSPIVLWIAVGVFALGFVLLAWSPLRR